MVKIGEIAKKAVVFEDNESVEIETLLNKDISLFAFARLTGSYGEFVVIKAKVKDQDKFVTFSTGAGVILERINAILNHFKIVVEEDNKIIKFPKKIEGKLFLIKSPDTNRSYYDFVSE